MSEVYESIMRGLNEAIVDAKSRTPRLKRTTYVVSVRKFTPTEIKKIRNQTGLSQKMFAGYMGVSNKTVEAWESGKNTPSGAASRLLSMMEMDSGIIKKYPFIKEANN